MGKRYTFHRPTPETPVRRPDRVPDPSGPDLSQGTYKDRLEAQRSQIEVTTAAERAQAQKEKRRHGKRRYRCAQAACMSGARFYYPGITCTWCDTLRRTNRDQTAKA